MIDPSDALEQSEYANTVDSNNGTHTWTLARNSLQVVPMANSGAQANWLATNAMRTQTLLTRGPRPTKSADSLQASHSRLRIVDPLSTREPATANSSCRLVTTEAGGARPEAARGVVGGQTSLPG